MRKLLLGLLCFIAVSVADAQVGPPKIKWSLSYSKSEVKVGEVIELIYTGVIDKDWYLYSNDFTVDGPQIATWDYKKNNTYQLIGDQPVAQHPKKKMDEVWGGEIKYFIDHAEFRHKVKILAANPVIKVDMAGQTCSDVVGSCIGYELLDKEFPTLKVSGGKTIRIIEDTTSKGHIVPPVNTTDDALSASAGTDQIALAAVDSPQTTIKPTDTATIFGGACNPLKFEDGSGAEEEEENLFIYAFIAFLSGLAALLTPCVFPMIPMTVTFFMKNSGSRAKAIRNGLVYGLSIIVIYTLIGVVLAAALGPQEANWLSTGAIVNIIFFIIFLLFAMSFFGMFEITLPSSFVNKVDKQSDRGGLIGVFFMAFTLVLVSFSCTGPIVGSIMVETSRAGGLKPVAGMLGFSMAFALPFTLFAIFPSWLQSLPKSGGWLNSVKVVLGFIELAMGFKFLSTADQTYHWHILDREIYIAIWIIIFFLMGMYLLGKLKFAHDSDLPFLGVPRLFLSIITFSFVVYLIPGMWGASLPGMAGYLPPTTSHSFNLPAMIRGQGMGNLCEKPKYSEFLELPHGLKGYFDYKQAIKCSRELKKPLFIDFTGHGCVNCRKMEEKVWADPQVLKRLQEDFVVVALYVDDRTELPQSEWVTSKVDGKVKDNIGRVNGDFQICNFDNNAQPYYCLLGNDEKLLAKPIGTNYNVDEFIKFLDGAKARFNKEMGIKE